jgi:hypothetical protein
MSLTHMLGRIGVKMDVLEIVVAAAAFQTFRYPACAWWLTDQ